MFRIGNRAIITISNVLKSTSKFPLKPKDHRAVINISNNLINNAFSTDSKRHEITKSPLENLILKDAGKEKAVEASDEVEGKESREQSWRRMKYTFIAFGASFTCIGIYMIVELGKPKINEDGTVQEDEFSNMNVVKQYILRTFGELNYYRQLIREPSRDKLLPDMVKHPYYSPQYTLVLEFTDVIVHPEWTYSTGWRFKKRPGLDHFLEALSGIYEIVVYTAEQGMTVFPIIEALDPKNHINYKLVRDATLFVDGKHVKDLDKLNRELTKTIVVDWDGTSTKYHPENVFQIPRWSGNDDDITLIHLASFLLAISQNQIEDVREVVKYYNEFSDPLGTFREKQKKLLELSEQTQANAPEEQAPVKKWTPNFLRKRI